MAFRGPGVWLWRWRRNPLKRRADVTDAWIGLASWVLAVLAGTLVGLVVARSVDQGLAEQRATWQPVVARVTVKAPPVGTVQARSGVRDDTVQTTVRWTAADGSVHTGQVRVGAGSPVGTPVTVWSDPRGRLVTEPATASQARLRATLTGVLAGLNAAAAPLLVGHLLRRRLQRRAIDRWDTEWARLGPLWGHTTN
ncbi:DUF3592 domain-containing protein [Streptomyces sp. NPDC090306]|uniref:Rv1733c family protein n=1 Tax=Streptomyces sp. NPDC090306 TaxID=3365961 RepID=UPI0037F7BAB2